MLRSMVLHVLILSLIWSLQFSLLSSVTPRYLTLVSCLINLPPSFRNFYFDLCFLLNRTAIVFVGLNFKFFPSPQWYNLFSILCVLLYISCVLLPPIIGPQSSANPWPVFHIRWLFQLLHWRQWSRILLSKRRLVGNQFLQWLYVYVHQLWL